MSSKHERTLVAVFEEPTRANILWRDVVSLLLHHGAEMDQGAGSRVAFDLGNATLVLHKPHPRKELPRYAVEALRGFLADRGIEP